MIGADRDRTGNPCLAKAVLSQLSYGPEKSLRRFAMIPRVAVAVKVAVFDGDYDKPHLVLRAARA